MSGLPAWIVSLDALVEYCELLRQENALLREQLTHRFGESQLQAIDRFIRQLSETRQEPDIEGGHADRP